MKPFNTDLTDSIDEGLHDAIMLAKNQRKAVVTWLNRNMDYQQEVYYSTVTKIYDELTTIINRLGKASNQVKLVSALVERMD